jgi:hypothetical protein
MPEALLKGDIAVYARQLRGGTTLSRLGYLNKGTMVVFEECPTQLSYCSNQGVYLPWTNTGEFDPVEGETFYINKGELRKYT